MTIIIKMIFRRRNLPNSNESETAKKIADLVRSRKVIVDAYEVERRRIERDLHDGTQQYLVLAAMKLGEAQLLRTACSDPQVAKLLGEAKEAIQKGLDSLRQTVRGIHPQVLSELGLHAALSDIANRSIGRIKIICPNPLPKIPEGVLAAAYFFSTEAIANAAKYAPDSNVTVLLTSDDSLTVSVVDDGPGGAQLRPGHGLAGMQERLAAFGGTMSISSPTGGPTQIRATLPLLIDRGSSAINIDGSER
ncbi:sensor histidine kinase [Propionimicrobium lymphophilum]|uniref:sensor histidine kinase n=1 Tax=Propionimicrobium lymphophilum TaxID=33012 RepID=UPI003EC53BDE